MTNRQENKRKKSPVSIVIIIIALCVLCFAGYKLFTIWQEYHAATVEYNQVAEEVVLDQPEAKEIDPTDRGDSFYIPKIDWETLLQKNQDTVAWLRFPKPEVINYPVVYSSDNEFYLHHTLEGSYLFSGCLFTDMHNERNMTDPNTIIYGHNMDNGAMFGDLDKYNKEDYFNANQYFYLQTPDGGAYKYQVLAWYETTDVSDSYQLTFADRAEFEAYQNKVKSLSMYESSAAVDPDKPVLTLSTCTNRAEDGRYLLQGILIETLREGETVLAPLNWDGEVTE